MTYTCRCSLAYTEVAEIPRRAFEVVTPLCVYVDCAFDSIDSFVSIVRLARLVQLCEGGFMDAEARGILVGLIDVYACACDSTATLCPVCRAQRLFANASPEDSPGLTPAQFAERAGISKGTVLNWLREGKLEGHQSPTGRWTVLSSPLKTLELDGGEE